MLLSEPLSISRRILSMRNDFYNCNELHQPDIIPTLKSPVFNLNSSILWVSYQWRMTPNGSGVTNAGFISTSHQVTPEGFIGFVSGFMIHTQCNYIFSSHLTSTLFIFTVYEYCISRFIFHPAYIWLLCANNCL